MKKNKNIELRIYELIGIKYFRKLVIGFLDIISIPLLLKKTKEERKKELQSNVFNYYIGNVTNLEKVKKFKKWLIFNAFLHIRSLYRLIPLFIQITSGVAEPSTTITFIVAAILNSYCVILQRYNWVRINQVIEKTKPHFEEKRNNLIDEINQVNLVLGKHSYKTIKLNGDTKNISFEKMISNASLDELRTFNNSLKKYKNIIENRDEFVGVYNEETGDEEFQLPLSDNKLLILTLNSKN